MDGPPDTADPPVALTVDPTEAARAVDPTKAALARYRRRGRILFILLAVFVLVVGGIVLALGGADASPRTILLAAIGLVIGLAVDYVLIVGLGAARPWADHATVVVCVILLLTGVTRSLIRLTNGAIDIPLEAIGAALVLAARPAAFPPSQPGDDMRVGLVALAALVSAGWPLVMAAFA